MENHVLSAVTKYNKLTYELTLQSNVLIWHGIFFSKFKSSVFDHVFDNFIIINIYRTSIEQLSIFNFIRNAHVFFYRNDLPLS